MLGLLDFARTPRIHTKIEIIIIQAHRIKKKKKRIGFTEENYDISSKSHRMHIKYAVFT